MTHVLGIDLSGPRNIKDTYVAAFRAPNAALHYLDSIAAADDLSIVKLTSDLAARGQVVVGIDAPLSYNPTGGDRPSDSALRRLVQQRNGRIGIMPPTMVRMVYLTLRGISLARLLEAALGSNIRIVEVHPGAALFLRGADRADLASIKKEAGARARLLGWLQTRGLTGVPQGKDSPDHFVMACAAALAAWDWSLGKPAWSFAASPPLHPFDFAC